MSALYVRRMVLLTGLLAIAVAAVERRPEAPPGYHVQEFGPFGGELFVPDGWFFTAPGGPSGGLYTAAKERSPDGSYDTGMRIQIMGGVKKQSGLSAREAVEINVRLRKEREKVIRECGAEDIGIFKRVCLETTGRTSRAKPQQEYHLVYSFWWNDDLDMMVGVTFGAPVESWDHASSVYGIMSHIKMFDGTKVHALAAGKAPAEPALAEESASERVPQGGNAPERVVDTSLDKAVKTSAVQFINRMDDLPWRLGTDLQPFSTFIDDARRVIAARLGEWGWSSPEVVSVVVGIPPKGRLRIWLSEWPEHMTAEQRNNLTLHLESVQPPPVRNGPVAFSLTLLLNGAKAPDVDPSKLKLPDEWTETLRGKEGVIIPDGLPEQIWASSAEPKT